MSSDEDSDIFTEGESSEDDLEELLNQPRTKNENYLGEMK